MCNFIKTKEKLSIKKVDSFAFFWRKILQKRKYVTELLNVCYISMNTLDIIKKKNKIIVSKKGKK